MGMMFVILYMSVISGFSIIMIIMKTCKVQTVVKNCAKGCTVIHSDREQTRKDTHTISVNIQLHQSIHLTHLQAISSTFKSHNHLTSKKKKKKNTQTATKCNVYVFAQGARTTRVGSGDDDRQAFLRNMQLIVHPFIIIIAIFMRLGGFLSSTAGEVSSSWLKALTNLLTLHG